MTNSVALALSLSDNWASFSLTQPKPIFFGGGGVSSEARRVWWGGGGGGGEKQTYLRGRD